MANPEGLQTNLTDEEMLESLNHYTRDDNPHNVTAAQIGVEKPLQDIIDSGSKNKLKNVATTTTSGEAVFTVNADGTISVYTTDTTAAPRNIQIASTAQNINVNSDDIVSGTPRTDKDVSMQFGIGASGNIKNIEPKDGYTTAGATGVLRYITIFVRSGVNIPQSEPLTFKPMICTATDWRISEEYVPYCPTLAELYAMVRG